MLINPSALAALSILIFCGPAAAQERLADLLADPATQLSRPADRARVVARMAGIENTRRQNARARATLLGLPLRTVAANGRIQEIAAFDVAQPIYFTTNNVNAAISTGANLLRNSPYSLNGSGVTIGLWDGGSARSTHQEFGGRVTVMDGAGSIDHATHVGGTLIATGVNAAARGMANSAIVHSYDWNTDVTEMTARGATFAGEPGKIYLSNHSYGYISGWNYVGGSGSPARTWEWWGSGTAASSIEPDFGLYNIYARDSDALAFGAPYYLMFRSAGNDGADNPSAGDVVSLAPGGGSVVSYNPSLHPAGDGTYRSGYETVSFDSVAKNVITIGSAADAVSGGIRDPNQAAISYFSSCGPTDDGRVKPDVVANGENLTSSLNGSNTQYGSYSGTSMATPNAVGSAALLIQQYGSRFPGQAMRSSTLKGLLIHTADDRGNAGPDYKYGWGLVNVKAAADLIDDQYGFPLKQRIVENQLTSATVFRTHSFVWDGISPIRATLCWTDPAAAALSAADSRSPRLVNNLNLKIVAPNGSEFLPFVMPFVGNWTPAAMSLPATTGINNSDNVEQVGVAAPPAAGTYQAVVSFSGTLANNSQNYSLLVSGSSAEPPPPPPLALATVSPNNSLAGAVTLDLTGTGLRADTAVKLARSGQTDIPATGGQLIGETLRCQVNLTGAAAGAWDVVATNPNLETSTLTAAFTVIGSIWSEAFDGTVTGWTSEATTGSNSWSLVTTQSKSPATSYFAPGPAGKTTANLTSPIIPVPAGATNLQLKFWQNRNLQNKRDAGKLEFSVDNGAWFDAGAVGSGTAFLTNGYNVTISATGQPPTRNEFADQLAWSGNSNGWVETIVNLTDTAKFAGKNLRLRWRIATDSSTASSGWYLDSMALIGGGNITNQAPIIATAATSSSTESVTDPDTTVYQIIRGTATNLSVTATDDAGEATLKYTWSVASGPGNPVFFPVNASNAAKNTTANFEAAGDYQISVAVLDGPGLATTSTVNLRVVQTAAGLVVSPASANVTYGGTQAFGATLLDQFSVAMVSQPSSFTWSASGGGTISPAGLFSATAAGGPYVIGASSGGFSNTASVTVTPAAATVVLSDLSPTYDGNPQAATVTTTPAALAVAVTYNGSAVVPTDAGNYAVEVNVTNPNYQGTTSGTLVIGKATATIDLIGLDQTYDGSPRIVTATTTPAGKTVLITYDSSSTAPTAAGSYAIAANISDANYQGSASGTLVIAPGNDWVSWRDQHFTVTEEAAGLAAETADPDFDNWPNLAEYALGTDPQQFTPPLVATRDANGLSVTFTRPANLPDVSYAAESTDDLGTWSPVPLEVLVPGAIETVRARDPLDTGNPLLRFLRLHFERP